jgi:hypothetical protein
MAAVGEIGVVSGIDRPGEDPANRSQKAEN